MENAKEILAIDDNIVQLNIFKTMLEDKYKVRTVNSASTALNFMNKNRVDLILLDIRMPNITGFDFLYDIRKIPSYMKVPVIIISSMEGQEFIHEAKKSSAFDVLIKPVDPELLIAAIEKALSQA
jgi:DNA-binding NtrC family response regulator